MRTSAAKVSFNRGLSESWLTQVPGHNARQFRGVIGFAA